MVPLLLPVTPPNTRASPFKTTSASGPLLRIVPAFSAVMAPISFTPILWIAAPFTTQSVIVPALYAAMPDAYPLLLLTVPKFLQFRIACPLLLTAVIPPALPSSAVTDTERFTAQMISPCVSPTIPPALPLDARTSFALDARYFSDVEAPVCPIVPRFTPTIPPTLCKPMTDAPLPTASISFEFPVTVSVPPASLTPAIPPTPLAFIPDTLLETPELSFVRIRLPLFRPVIPPTAQLPDADTFARL